MTKIIHYADVQVKNREKNLFKVYNSTLKEIEKIIKTNEYPIVIISGDLFEYAIPNDSERKLINNHLSRLLKIQTLKELVLIAGNHDLIKEKKQIDHMSSFNPLSIFNDMLEELDSNKHNKLIYIKESKIYQSKVDENINYIGYSLEDNENIDLTNLDSSKTNLCIYHGMIKEYVDYANIPLRKDMYNELRSIETFPENTFILAGDIHESLIFDGLNFQKFYYPGSTTQHTHKEGNYYSVSEDIKNKIAEKKYLNLYDFSEKSFSRIELNNPIEYNTVELDYRIPADIIINNLNNLDIRIGSEKTYLKIKSSNIFITIEKQIFEFFHNKFGIKNIEFENSKFVNQTNLSSNNKIIDKIIEEKNLTKTNFTSDIISNENIDDLILNENQLKKLFESVLDTIIEKTKNEFDEFTLDEIKNDIISLFVGELNLSTSFASKRYNIELLSVETNGFMALCANVINLTIPGIVRIIGTNGIGKTTLYNMLRWVFTGDVFDGMSKSSLIKNNLIVFDKNKPENDFVFVKLHTKVNGQKITLTRSVTRKWKNLVTDTQKMSISWKEYVTTVDREFHIDLINESGESKRFSGDVAEKAIKTWIGKSVENILFLNQVKIEKILSLNSDKLNELILDFIGVDYLQKLEANLDTVKSNLSKTKPKRNSEDIKNAIIDNKIFIKKIEDKILEQEKAVETKNIELTEDRDKLQSINEELINIGNIPQLIENIDSKIKTIDTELLVSIPEKKPLIEFLSVKPELSEEKINDFSSKINENKKLINVINEKTESIDLNIEKNIENIETNIKKIIDDLNSKKEKYNKTIENNLLEIKETYKHIFNECELKTTTYQNKIIEIGYEIKEYFKPISEYVETKLEAFQNKKIEKITDNANLLTENKQLEELNTNIQNQISSGICSYCGSNIKKNDKTDAEWETEKTNLNNSIAQNYNKIYSNMLILNENLLLLEKIKKYIETFNTLKIQVFDLNIVVFENELIFKQFENVKQSIIDTELFKESFENDLVLYLNFMGKFQNNFEFFKTSELFVDEFKQISDYIDENVSIKKEHIDTCQIIIDEFNECLKIKHNDYSCEKYFDKESWKDLSALIVNDKEYKASIKKLTIRNNELIEENTILSQNIDDIKTEYTESLEAYQKEYEDNVKENSLIEKNNQAVDIKILNNLKLEIEKSELIAEKTALNDKSIIFNNKSIEKSELIKLIDTKNNELIDIKKIFDELNFNLIKFQNQKDSLDKEYNEYIEYIKNSVIWKIYSNLIKNSFKEIVFEYYRNFLNNTLNYLLENVNFKLFWNNDSELIHLSTDNNKITYQPVQQSSGMETCFLGLSLIYTMHLLNVKNSISHLFIDEISGTLNSGNGLSYEAQNYKELLVLLLAKFTTKSIFIIDHSIDSNLFETASYEVKKGQNGSIYNILN